MLVKPEAERILDYTRNEGRTLARRQPLLGLTGELRIFQLDREYITDAVPDVFRADLHAAGHEAAKLAELAQRLGQAGSQSIDMGAALRGRNQVDIGFSDQFAAFRQPGNGPVDGLVLAGHAFGERLERHGFLVVQVLPEVVLQTTLVQPCFFLAAFFLEEADFQARAQHGLGAQHMLQARHRKARRIKVLLVRPEVDTGARVALAHGTGFLQLCRGRTAFERHVVDIAVSPDLNIKLRRQCVNHGNADAVQSA